MHVMPISTTQVKKTRHYTLVHSHCITAIQSMHQSGVQYCTMDQPLTNCMISESPQILMNSTLYGMEAQNY